MKFASPWSLVLLLVLPLWLWWERRSAQRGGLKFSSVATARSLSSFWSALGPSILLLLRGATLALFIVALARPQLGRSESKIKTEGIDIVLVIDISGSMQAMDYEKGGQRESRIDAVKDVVREFIRSRPNDRIGMVVFGTHAYVASPLTLDHDWLERNLDRVRIGLVEGNTAIGAGIGTGVNRLRDTQAKSKVIVLLTDGGENIKNPPALDAAKAAKEFGVRVYTVGAGSQGLAPMPVYDRAGNLLGYQQIQADLDEDLLKQVAAATGGQYFRAADTASLKKTYAQIDAMEKQKVETVAYEDWQELFPWFLAPGLGCLMLAVTLEHTRLRRLP
jgi:Ca-activated chloride channel family protein